MFSYISCATKNNKPITYFKQFDNRELKEDGFEDGSEWEKEEFSIHPSSFAPFLTAGEFVVSRSLIKLAFERSSNTESVKHSVAHFCKFSFLYCFFFFFFDFFISKRNESTCRSSTHLRDNLWSSESVKNFNIVLIDFNINFIVSMSNLEDIIELPWFFFINK